MNKMPKVAVLVAVTVLCAGAFFIVSAGSHHLPSPPGVEQQRSDHVVPDASVNEQLARNYLTAGSPSVAILAGFNVEDAGVSFNCPKPTCTLVVESWATTGTPVAQPNNRALCLVVDGNIVGPCAYNGESAADGTYSQETSFNQFQVNNGGHSAFVYIYSDYGETLYTYQNTYRVYAP